MGSRRILRHTTPPRAQTLANSPFFEPAEFNPLSIPLAHRHLHRPQLPDWTQRTMVCYEPPSRVAASTSLTTRFSFQYIAGAQQLATGTGELKASGYTRAEPVERVPVGRD